MRAAADIKYGSGDPLRAIRGKERNGIRNILGPTGASERNASERNGHNGSIWAK